MSRAKDRVAIEHKALALLTGANGWTTPVALAKSHGEDWRSMARALRRLAGKDVVSSRQVTVPRDKGRFSVRWEYRVKVQGPMLVLMPPFDPSKMNIVGVRVVRFD